MRLILMAVGLLLAACSAETMPAEPDFAGTYDGQVTWASASPFDDELSVTLYGGTMILAIESMPCEWMGTMDADARVATFGEQSCEWPGQGTVDVVEGRVTLSEGDTSMEGYLETFWFAGEPVRLAFTGDLVK